VPVEGTESGAIPVAVKPLLISRRGEIKRQLLYTTVATKQWEGRSKG